MMRLTEKVPNFISVRIALRKDDLLLPLLFSSVPETVARAISPEKETKDIHKERRKLSLFAHYMILYIENTEASTKSC